MSNRLARAYEVIAIVGIFGGGVFFGNAHPAWWLLGLFLLMITDRDRRNDSRTL